MPLQVENLSKRFGSNWALRDVTFEAADGEIFGIFGVAAAGKTTLLRCIAGIEQSSGGSVSLDGAATSELSSKQRDIHFVGANNEGGISRLFGGKRPARASSEDRIADLRQGAENSKRVSLFDEPFAGTDEGSREQMVSEIRSRINDRRIGIFASSHFEEIALVCDRVAVMAKGEIEQVGTPREVYEDPATIAVASAIGVKNLLLARRLTSTNAAMPEFITIDGNHRLFAHPADIAKLGAINQNVTLAVHPEQLSISFGASFPEDNLLKAIVTGIRFRGATTMVDLDAEGLKLQARVFRVVGLNVGDECMIAIPPDRLIVLKD